MSCLITRNTYQLNVEENRKNCFTQLCMYLVYGKWRWLLDECTIGDLVTVWDRVLSHNYSCSSLTNVFWVRFFFQKTVTNYSLFYFLMVDAMLRSLSSDGSSRSMRCGSSSWFGTAQSHDCQRARVSRYNGGLLVLCQPAIVGQGQYVRWPLTIVC